MKRSLSVWMAAAGVTAAGLVLAQDKTEIATSVTRKVVEARPLSPEALKGLDWLVKHQLPGGGWGQGEESSNMGGGGTLRDVPNVADTCMAAMALLRSGSTPARGENAEALRKGVAFVCEQVRNADDKSLYVTEIRGTRLQGKIGTYVDTFLAAQMLTEMRDVMPDDASRAEVSNCLAKVIRKIESNQKQDGGWSGDGWAPVHSEALATKALNRAAAKGVAVSEQVRLKAQDKAGSKFDRGSGEFRKDGAAGIDLYAVSSTLNSMQESQNYNASVQREVEQAVAQGASEAAVRDAKERLEKFDENRQALEASKSAVVEKLDDERFIAGFGNNGGEEFLSYLNIGESLVVEGGEPWTKWDEKMSANLKRIQNGDGSWSGHHCITGRSFCTATALMVLMVDRMTLPSGGALAKR